MNSGHFIALRNLWYRHSNCFWMSGYTLAARLYIPQTSSWFHYAPGRG